jgi:hypothetical protein
MMAAASSTGIAPIPEFLALGRGIRSAEDQNREAEAGEIPGPDHPISIGPHGGRVRVTL